MPNARLQRTRCAHLTIAFRQGLVTGEIARCLDCRQVVTRQDTDGEWMAVVSAAHGAEQIEVVR